MAKLIFLLENVFQIGKMYLKSEKYFSMRKAVRFGHKIVERIKSI